ncbi:MAG: ATP-binding protein [Bacteroidota bacterium]
MLTEEVKLKDLLENSIEMIHQLDESGHIRWVNRSWRENLEIGDENLTGQHLVQFLTEETMDDFKAVFPELQQGIRVENLNCTFKTRSGKIINLIGRTVPIFENGKVIGSQAFLQDVTKLLAIQNELKQIHDLQGILMNISNRFINLNFEELDFAIDQSLQEIAHFSRADRAYVFRYDLEQQLSSNTHEWCATGISPQIQNLKSIQLAEMPYWYGKHSKGELIEVSDVSVLIDERVKSMLRTEGIQSLLTIPMMDGDNVIGFIGFDVIRKQRTFRLEEKEILGLFAQMLVNVINRMQNLDELKKSKKEIERINENLENKVMENTLKNLSLSKTIVEQDKLATIGEISAGIAHDLNTPLGTIKVGADNIRYVFDLVIRSKVSNFNSTELNQIMDRIQNFPVEIYLGGLQLRREKSEMITLLETEFNLPTGERTEKIAELLVKCRINNTEKEFIDKILKVSDSIAYLDLLNQLQLALSQLETIKTSSDKAVRVVQEVRSFIKGNTIAEKVEINLRQNISTVLSVFNYELKKDIDLKFTVSPEIHFMGYDVKLFQLWSNIVKNAIEAMDNQDYKYLGIHANLQGDKITVEFENNGPQIPEDVRQNMFKKFYTTKSKLNGTGLGLSIVNNVLSEHKATINVESNECMTKFIITFDI